MYISRSTRSCRQEISYMLNTRSATSICSFATFSAHCEMDIFLLYSFTTPRCHFDWTLHGWRPAQSHAGPSLQQGRAAWHNGSAGGTRVLEVLGPVCSGKLCSNRRCEKLRAVQSTEMPLDECTEMLGALGCLDCTVLDLHAGKASYASLLFPETRALHWWRLKVKSWTLKARSGH